MKRYAAFTAVFCLFCLTATTWSAITTVFNADVDAGWNVGSGQSNGCFVVNTNGAYQTALRVQERYVGPVSSSNGIYHVLDGESEPGIALWNFDFSVDVDRLGAADPFTLGDFTVILAIDFDPAVGNTNRFELNLSAIPELSSLSLVQDSQNLGFGFWQTITDPDIMPFDPLATGEYEFSLSILSGTEILSEAEMTVVVSPIPAPGAILLGSIGLGIVSWLRRRRRL